MVLRSVLNSFVPPQSPLCLAVHAPHTDNVDRVALLALHKKPPTNAD